MCNSCKHVDHCKQSLILEFKINLRLEVFQKISLDKIKVTFLYHLIQFHGSKPKAFDLLERKGAFISQENDF